MNIRRQVTWNTGTQYTPEGQIVTVAEMDDGRILFHDHSRMIWGRITTLRTVKEPLWQFGFDQYYIHSNYEGDCDAGQLRPTEVGNERS